MSIKKIAEMTGASPSTVARVLRDPQHKCASEQMKQNILNAAREIGYVPNEAARLLRRGRETGEEVWHCKPALFDLHAEKNEIAEIVKGFDAVYFLAGSRGQDLLQTDAFGAVKLMQACETAGIRRFIMLSSIFALEPKKWAQEKSLQNITNYNIAKFFADNYLVSCTDLDYTIVQPSVLQEVDGTGLIELDPEHDGANPIPDVAEVLVSVLEMENTFKKVIKMRSGNTPISSALENM